MSALRKTILLLTLFSIAMGFMESAVVIYLRELYYPKGFQFPLTPITPLLSVVELLREAATIIMLACIGGIAGKTFAQRFSFFVYCFAIWDLFYYVFLKIFLGWPESFFTFDILFLIPVLWVGPVNAPCILSLTMISLMLAAVYFHERDISVTISTREWLIMIFGTIVVILSFTLDYISYVLKSGHQMWTPMSSKELFNEISGYIPQSFNWWLFTGGEALIVAGIIRIIIRHKRKVIDASM
jgi:hypothetical protein